MVPPETGEMFVLWEGNGLAVESAEHVHGEGAAPELRLKSANPAYADCTLEGPRRPLVTPGKR